ncbi:hypothetical protein ACET3X_007252 [Alternaria dauci]|uniref:DUF6594 domain-containing protein n=1 Tax=Alternaria dauci TaxID=48095 RepID=A0ABR3UBF4_9PLEO
MSDHTAPLEGSDSPSRQRSPTPGDPTYHYESLNDIGKSSAASAPYTRRRPSRTSSGSKGTPPSASPPRGDDHDESEQRNRPPRTTLKKLLRRDSHHVDTASTSQGNQEELDEEGSTIGYMPRLGQIRESKSKVSTRTRRRGRSVVSSPADARVLRRRHTGDNSVKRSHARDKRSSLQRHAGDMANVSDPSLVSSVTQQSDVSSGSNSTALQRPYSGYSNVVQYLEPDESHSPSASTTVESPAPHSINATQPAVFQYLQSSDETTENFSPTPTDLQAMPPSIIASSSSSSSSDTQHDDGRSSVAADSQHTIDSPMTSPASTRRSFQTSSHLPNQEFRKFKKPLYASSFVHGPGDEAEGTQEEGSDESGSGSESEEEVNHKNQIPGNHATVTMPPRAPSTGSHQSDPHASRLKQQERELANHILQAPEPYQNYQYGADQPTYNYPPMPMYNPQGYSSASPAAMNAATSSAPGWPPMASFPAPLAIGYAPHQSPETAHAHPLSTIRPPDNMSMIQQQHMPPPFSPHATHPPLYQHHASPSNSQTKSTVIGYELLATELSRSTASRRSGGGGSGKKKRGLVPMYRKFEHLNHRVLLHLQDETSELEQELRNLDECIAQSTPRDADGYVFPASRRGDARYGGDLHFKRTELLGRIYQKLEQYNKALASFNQVSISLERPSQQAIHDYREWMDAHEPIDETESAFLERDDDLVTIGSGNSSGSSSARKPATTTAVPTPPPAPSTATAATGQPDASPRSTAPPAITLPLLAVLPLVAFAIVPTLLGRVVVILGAICVLGKMVRETPVVVGMLSLRDWGVVAAVYFGVNVLLAALVR